MNEQFHNLNQLLLNAMDNYADRICFQVRRGKRFQSISYRRFQRYAFRLAHYFRQQGINAGERVAIVADNPLEWIVVYIAGLLAGGAVVPLHAWWPRERLKNALKDSGACLAVVQGEAQPWLLEAVGESLPALCSVLIVGDEGVSSPGVATVSTIMSRAIGDEAEAAIRAHAVQVPAEALALIYYKSSRPLGAMFTHTHRLAAMESMAEWFPLDEDDVALTPLFSWSLATLDATLYYFVSGVPHVVTGRRVEEESPRLTPPTIVLTTPSGFEEFYTNVMVDINQLPSARRTMFQWALNMGRQYVEAGLAASKKLRDDYARANSMFFSRIRGQFGGRVRRVYSTGAPLRRDLSEFAEIVGITALNLYSLTEAGGFPIISRPDARRPDSCGQVAPEFQVRIADDGEVLVRGKSVMCGYWRQPELTAEVFDGEGWLHTGDLGRFDQDGFLYLTGHKQAVISLSTGRTIMPTAIESALTDTAVIAQAAVFGEGRPYLSALIVPDGGAISSYLQAESGKGQSSTALDPDIVRSLIDRAVGEVNKLLDGWVQLKAYELLPKPFSQEQGEVTSANKLCREIIARRYASQIEAMYPQTLLLNKPTQVTRVELEPEELHELLAKQDLLDAWLADAGIEFLFDLAREKQIDPPSMVHISDTVATIAQMHNEEKPLSTAFIVGDPVFIARHLAESEIQLQRYDHIRRMRQVVTNLARMVDGLVLAYVLDKHGYVRGIYKILSSLPKDFDDMLLGPQFRRHATISRVCNAVVFFVPTGGHQVRVFADGKLVGRYSNGNWSAEEIEEVGRTIANLAETKGYDLLLVRRILRCAFKMSEDNLGAIFIIGQAEAVLSRSDPPEISGSALLKEAKIADLADQEIVNFAKQDGATIIDREGTFRGCMVLLRPDAATQAEIGPGKGARHSSAAKMSAETQCLAVVVSQDGPITVYDAGQRVLSL